MATSDGELLDAWRDGDRASGSRLFERHFSALYRFFRNKISGGVEDLVQQTFLACVEGKERFRGESSFRTYLYAIARKQLYKRYRGRRMDQAIDFGVSSVADLGASPSGIVAQRAEQRLVLEALRRIPVDYQIALELYHLEGFRGPQLAAILEVPEPTVRGRLRRGLEQLRKQLAQLEATPDEVRSTTADLEKWAGSLRELVEKSIPD